MKLKKLISLLLCACMLASSAPVHASGEDALPDQSDACPHAYEAASVVEPSCSEPGYTVYICALCGDVLRGDYTDPLPHTPVETGELPPSCTEPGRASGTVCALCGEILDGCGEIPALGHTPVEVGEIPLEGGLPGRAAGHVCAVCGEVLDGCEELPAPEKPVITIELQPESAVPADGEVSFRVVASVSTDDELRCQWQRLDLGVEYKDETEREAAWEDAESASGGKETRDVLTLAGLDDETVLAEALRHAYRCVLTAGEASEKTAEARVLLPEAEPQSSAREAKGVVASGVCGADLSWTLYDSGVLSISGTGDMTDYHAGDEAPPAPIDDEEPETTAPWFDAHGDEIRSVVIGQGVTGIGNCAFSLCAKLQSVTIPSSVRRIGKYAFSECDLLSDVTLPAGLTEIGNGAFSSCYSLSEIAIPELITEIKPAVFSCCSGLLRVTIPASVSKIGEYAFDLCGALSDVYFGGTAERWVQINIGAGNAALTSAAIHYGSGSTEPPTTGRCGVSAFWSFRDGVLTVSGSGATFDCGIGEAPWAALSAEIKTVVIGSGITRIGARAFQDCSRLTSVTLPESGLSEIGECAFYYCGSLERLVTNASYIGDQAFAYCGALRAVALKQGVETVGRYAFSHCARLSSISLPTSLLIVDTNAFLNCPAVKNAFYSGTAEQWSHVFVYQGNGALADALSFEVGSSNLAGDNIIWLIEDGVLKLSGSGATYSFAGAAAPWAGRADEIAAVEVGNGISSLGKEVFMGLEHVSRVSLPKTLTSISDNAFKACSSLGTVSVPDQVRSVGAGCFSQCASLRSVRLPAGLRTIGSEAFRSCGVLAAVQLPDKLQELGAGAFYGCGSLASIRLPASLREISASAFSGCGALRTVSLPKTLLAVHESAFADCGALTTVYFAGSEAQWNSLAPRIEAGNQCLLNARREYGSGSTVTIAYKNVGGAYNPNPSSLEKGEVYTLQPPVKTGYAFKGWYTNSSLKAKYRIETVTAGKNTTLYAKFTALTYTVHFDGNGAASGSMKDLRAESGKKTKLTKNAFVRPGYRFLGWTLLPEYSPEEDTLYPNKSAVNFDIDSACLTLYAQWRPINYRISYSGVGSTDGNPNPATYTVEDPLILLQPPVRAGCSFEGWYLKHEKNTYSDPIDRIDPSGAKDLTVYAKWSGTACTYRIVFDPNVPAGSHSPASGSTRAVSCRLNTKYELSENRFTRAGYRFTGWNTKPDGSGTAYRDKQKQVCFSPSYPYGATTADVTLYAQWEAISYSVTYRNDGGRVYNENNPVSYTVEDLVVLRDPSSDPYAGQCSFDGWYLKYKNRKYSDPVSRLEHRTGNLTVYAKWTQSGSGYDVRFDGSGKDSGSMSPMKKLPLWEERALTKNAFGKTGYSFAGWSLSPGAEEPLLKDQARVNYAELFELAGRTPAQSYTLYAVWKPDYIIHYDANGGAGSMDDQKAGYAEKISLRKNSFRRAGYMFLGWSLDPDALWAAWKGGAKVSRLNGGETRELTLYAVWQPIAGYFSPEGTEITTSMVRWNAERYIAALDTDGDGKLNCEWFWNRNKAGQNKIKANADKARSDASQYLVYLTTSGNRNTSNYFSGCSQCAGFANLMVYVTTGLKPGNLLQPSSVSTGTYRYDFSSDFVFQPGDYCRIPGSSDGSHSIFIYKVSGNTVYYIDCNSDGLCGIKTHSIGRSSLIGKLNVSRRDWLWRGPVVEG